MKNNKSALFLSFFLSLVLFTLIFAQDSEAKSGWLLGVIFKLEGMRTAALEDIQKFEAEIRKNENTLAKSENILRLAREQGNVQAEQIAREAAAKAQAAKAKNIKSKNEAELNLKKANIALAHVKNAFSDALGNPRKIKSVITNYSGRVSIQKKSGAVVDLDLAQAGLLEKGDEVFTYGDGRVELQFLEGRGTLKVGPDSRIKMEEDDAGTEIMNMARGRVRVAVEKAESYQENMEEKLQTFHNDINGVKDKAFQKIEDSYKAMVKDGKRFRAKCEVWIPMAVCAVQGTRFAVRVDEQDGSEIVVFEGSVELTGRDVKHAVLVIEGHRAMVDKDGNLSEPEKIDPADPEAWWEE